MKLIVIYGPPAAGKLTVSQELSKRIGFEIFHNHITYDIFRQVVKEHDDDFWDRVHRLRLELIGLAVKNDINLIFTFCYELSDADFINSLKKTVTYNGGQIYFVHLTPNEKVLLARVIQPSRHNYKKIKDPQQLTELLKTREFYQSINDTNSIKIDNSKLSPEQVVDKIIEKYKI